MNTATPTTNPAPQALLPEQWLLVTANTARLFAFKARLAAADSAITQWRLAHSRVSFVMPAAMPTALAKAMASGSACVHLHADLPEDALYADVRTTLAGPDGHRLLHRVWRADGEGERHDGDGGSDDSTLLADLARPDAWVELGWWLNGRKRVPPLRVPGADDSATEQHRLAFEAWAADRLASLDADELAALDARYADDADDDTDALADQPEPDWAATASLLLPLAVPGHMMKPAQRLKGMASAAGLGTGPAAAGDWQQQVVWSSALPPGARRAGMPLYRVQLQTRLNMWSRQPEDLRLRLELNPDHWARRAGVQVWLVPERQAPVQLGMGDAGAADLVNHSGMLVLTAPLPLPAGTTAQALLAALQGSSVMVSAENRRLD